jgi:hypothetical protein
MHDYSAAPAAALKMYIDGTHITYRRPPRGTELPTLISNGQRPGNSNSNSNSNVAALSLLGFEGLLVL